MTGKKSGRRRTVSETIHKTNDRLTVPQAKYERLRTKSENDTKSVRFAKTSDIVVHVYPADPNVKLLDKLFRVPRRYDGSGFSSRKYARRLRRHSEASDTSDTSDGAHETSGVGDVSFGGNDDRCRPDVDEAIPSILKSSAHRWKVGVDVDGSDCVDGDGANADLSAGDIQMMDDMLAETAAAFRFTRIVVLLLTAVLVAVAVCAQRGSSRALNDVPHVSLFSHMSLRQNAGCSGHDPLNSL